MRFVSVTKPGIIFGNLVTAIGGFFLASHHAVNFLLLFWALIGITLVIASGCVFNNCIDIDIDPLMKRTQNRVLPQGLMSIKTALLYALVLSVAGLLVLYFKTNLLTLTLAIIGLFFYVVVYSLWLKRTSVYGTVIGAISGAMPPVIAYCAVTNHLDLGALCLFLILIFWQLPHFYAIVIYRLSDYKAASIPVLPLIKNVPEAKRRIVLYIILFTLVSIAPAVLGYAGIFYGIIALLLGAYWLYVSLSGFTTQDDASWARKVFLFSLIAITVLSGAMVI